MLVLTKVPLGSGLPMGLAGPSASGGVPRDWLPDAAEQEPGATPRSGAAPQFGPCSKARVQRSASDIDLSCPELGTFGRSELREVTVTLSCFGDRKAALDLFRSLPGAWPSPPVPPGRGRGRGRNSPGLTSEDWVPACEGPGGGSRSKDHRCDPEPSWDGASGAVRTPAVAALGALASASPRAGTPGRACVHCPSCGWRRTSLVPWAGSPTARALNPSDEAAARTAGALAGCLPSTCGFPRSKVVSLFAQKDVVPPSGPD